MSKELSNRLGRFGFGSGRKTSSHTPSPPPNNQGHPSGAGAVQQRPPSYPPPYQPPPQGPQQQPHLQGVGRATSPMPQQGPYGPGQIGSIPPSLPPPMNMAPPGSSYGHPPTYGGQPQGNHRDSHGPTAMGHPTMGRPQAAEVEGGGRSKAQLIVGIDFVSGAPIRSCAVRKSGLTDDVGIGYYFQRCRFRFRDRSRG